MASRTQRSRDFLVGCVTRVTINGQVVDVSASGHNLLRQYRDAFDQSPAESE